MASTRAEGVVHVAALPGAVGHPEGGHHRPLTGVVFLEDIPVQGQNDLSQSESLWKVYFWESFFLTGWKPYSSPNPSFASSMGMDRLEKPMMEHMAKGPPYRDCGRCHKFCIFPPAPRAGKYGVSIEIGIAHEILVHFPGRAPALGDAPHHQ